MNGIHDLGGMHGLGPIEYETDEPPFHHEWEARVWGLGRAIGPWGRGRSWGSFRFALESLPPTDYLRMSYYERWFSVWVGRLLGSGLVTPAELDRGHADPRASRPTRLPAPARPSLGSSRLALDVAPRFEVSQRVRARTMHPRGHTRLPRYTRGKLGTIVRDHGVYDLQDTDVHGQRFGDRPQHVYSVRFPARELWGDRASARDAVYVDLWEHYLEPA